MYTERDTTGEILGPTSNYEEAHAWRLLTIDREDYCKNTNTERKISFLCGEIAACQDGSYEHEHLLGCIIYVA